MSETGCDALILHYASHEPLSYAASWNRPLQRTDPSAYEATLARWLDYYASAGIEMIASGAVILRRRSKRRTWARAIEVPDAPTGSAGEHVERLFAAQDELARLLVPKRCSLNPSDPPRASASTKRWCTETAATSPTPRLCDGIREWGWWHGSSRGSAGGRRLRRPALAR